MMGGDDSSMDNIFQSIELLICTALTGVSPGQADVTSQAKPHHPHPPKRKVNDID